MTELVSYTDELHDLVVRLIAEFFAEHGSMTAHPTIVIDEGRLAMAEENLADWIAERDTDYRTHIFLLVEDGENVGFLILKTHGGSVVWIEDIYVRAAARGRGIATRAIALAEAYATETMHAPAICMDVVPQNEAAWRLYYKLGYDTISQVTLRKAITEEKRTERVSFMGYEFLK